MQTSNSQTLHFASSARSFKVGVPTAIFMAVAGAVYKDSRLNGWELFPVPPARDMGSIDYRKFDFTLTKDIRDEQK